MSAADVVGAPFRMLPSRYAALTRDGKHVTSGRASYVWQTYLENVASGVPGDYRIRRAERGAPWHRLNVTVEEAERGLSGGVLGRDRARRARMRRAARARDLRSGTG